MRFGAVGKGVSRDTSEITENSFLCIRWPNVHGVSGGSDYECHCESPRLGVLCQSGSPSLFAAFSAIPATAIHVDW
jgi:hypothetical protein